MLLAYPFRLFFLLVGLFAALVILIWLAVLLDWLSLPPGIFAGAVALPRNALWVLAERVWFHALGIGAMGTLIVGVMTRVAVAHTGRPLTLLRGAQPSYWLVTAVLRLAAVLGAGLRTLYATGLASCAAFALFTIRYAPILYGPRVDGQPG